MARLSQFARKMGVSSVRIFETGMLDPARIMAAVIMAMFFFMAALILAGHIGTLKIQYLLMKECQFMTDRGPTRHEQIYQMLREQILTGRLEGGKMLVPSRILAEELGVSRNTVLTALDRLRTEGYIETRMGAGCFVNENLVLPQAVKGRRNALPPTGFKPYRRDIVDFRSGLPDLDSFPVGIWSGLYREVMAEVTPADLGYSQPEGRPELRREIANYVRSFRGVVCSPENVVVTSGTTQAIGILGRYFFRDGAGAALLEDPITIDIQEILRGCGAGLHFAPVDAAGLRLDEMASVADLRLIYVTPSHQYPLGSAMPARRRVALLEYARTTGAYIVEDDYDSEYRYDSRPVSAIQGMHPEGVVYIGTFSKTISPAVRTGYLVLPTAMVTAFRKLKWQTDLHNSVFDQLVLAKFIQRGSFHRHLTAMKKLYSEKRTCLIDALSREFDVYTAGQNGDAVDGQVEILGEKAGIHLCARFNGIVFDNALLSRLEATGVKVYPVEEHAATAPTRETFRDTVIIGFGMLSLKRIDEGVKLLASALGR